MANLSTDNINTIAQLSASIDDEDYIYIFKVSSGTIARVTKAQLLQDIANSGGGISETVYAAIRNNVNVLQAKVDDIINIIRNNMANYAFPNGRPSIDVVGQLYWPSGGDTPVLTPVLISPSSDINATLEYGADSVTIPVNITGSNLTKPLTLAVNGAGFTPASLTIQASAANEGTSIALTYARQQGAESATGSLSISSEDGISRTVDINVTFAQDQGGGGEEPSDTYTELYNVTGKPLLLHLDGLSQGGQSGKWIDKVSGKEFVLNGNPTVESNGVTFDTVGQYGLCSTLLSNLAYGECTIEICFTADSVFGTDGQFNPLFVTNVEDKIAFIYGYSSSSYKHFDYRTRNTAVTSEVSWKVPSFTPAANTLYRVSMNKQRLVVNEVAIGEANTSGIAPAPSDPNGNYPMMIGGRVGSQSTRVAHATIHEVRIYQGLLTETEMQTNQQTDNRSDRYGTGSED